MFGSLCEIIVIPFLNPKSNWHWVVESAFWNPKELDTMHLVNFLDNSQGNIVLNAISFSFSFLVFSCFLFSCSNQISNLEAKHYCFGTDGLAHQQSFQ